MTPMLVQWLQGGGQAEFKLFICHLFEAQSASAASASSNVPREDKDGQKAAEHMN